MKLVEKYRPKRLDDIIGQNDIVKSLKDIAKREYRPHMLFVGPAGTGKTSAAYASVSYTHLTLPTICSV